MKLLVTLTAVFGILASTTAMAAAPAYATDGKKALALCKKRGGACKAVENRNGSIVIEVDNGENGTGNIHCESKKAQCTVTPTLQAPKTPTKPTIGGTAPSKAGG